MQVETVKRHAFLFFGVGLLACVSTEANVFPYPSDGNTPEASIASEGSKPSVYGGNLITTDTAQPYHKPPGDSSTTTSEIEPNPPTAITPLAESPQGPNQVLSDPAEPNTPNGGHDWIKMRSVDTELFLPGGPTYNEVLQPSNPSCTLYATLGSLAAASPDRVRKMIKLTGQTADLTDVYSVTLFNNRSHRFEDVRVDSAFYGIKSSPNSFFFDKFFTNPVTDKLVLWPSLIQKAFASFSLGYDNLPTNEMIAMYVLTGQLATPILTPATPQDNLEVVAAELRKYVGTGYVTTVDSALWLPNQANDSSGTPVSSLNGFNCALVDSEQYCLLDAHEYQVISFEGSEITIRNPWGYNKTWPDVSKGQLILPLPAYRALTQFTWRSMLPVSEWSY